ncbi:MAG: DUF465 domain-containing protein [Pseudomonadota bacterium]
MDEQEQADLRLAIAKLSQEHKDLGVAIDAMAQIGADPLAAQRLKKKKLTMKDRLAKLQSQLIPDMPA